MLEILKKINYLDNLKEAKIFKININNLMNLKKMNFLQLKK
jgi:hypothetical protein